MKNKIYTTGFTGKDVADLPKLLDRLDAVLADIRFTPFSKDFEWRREYLKLLLKNRYHHVSSFGNRTGGNRIGGNRTGRENRISIHNFNLGLKIIESWNENVVLMCDCENLENCHRSVLTNDLREKDFDVQEIENWQSGD